MRYKLLVQSLALPLIVGVFGSAVTLNSISTWYVTLNKPVFSPPNFLFGPVWTTLYVLMGIALYLILVSNKKKEHAIKIFLLQLFLNLLWSLVFFGLHNILLAFVVILLLWAAIFQNIRVFLKISKTAGQLLIPYILWVSFAALLNLSIFLLNK